MSHLCTAIAINQPEVPYSAVGSQMATAASTKSHYSISLVLPRATQSECRLPDWRRGDVRRCAEGRAPVARGHRVDLVRHAGAEGSQEGLLPPVGRARASTRPGARHRGAGAVLRAGDEAGPAREPSDVLFTVPHYDGYGAVLVRMADADIDDVADWLEAATGA